MDLAMISIWNLTKKYAINKIKSLAINDNSITSNFLNKNEILKVLDNKKEIKKYNFNKIFLLNTEIWFKVFFNKQKFI